MLFQVLGHVEVRSARGRVIHLRPREKAVLGVLLLHAGTSCSADMLLQDVWGMTSPQTPAALSAWSYRASGGPSSPGA